MKQLLAFILLSLLLAGVAEAGPTWSEKKAVCNVNSLDCAEYTGKVVITEYNDFIKMISMKEHSDKTANQKAAENAVLVRLKDEQGSIIKVQAEQIRNCEGIVRTQEQLGATQEEIAKAVDDHLRDLTKEIAREKRLSRYKSETVWIGVLVALGLWVVN